MTSPHRSSPAYASGYEDGIGGRQPILGTEAYRDGHAAGRWTRDLFASNGLAPDGSGGFSAMATVSAGADGNGREART